METEILKTSDEWHKETDPNTIILDADGWDRQNFQYSFYEEKITLNQFENRLSRSTIKMSKEKMQKMREILGIK